MNSVEAVNLATTQIADAADALYEIGQINVDTRNQLISLKAAVEDTLAAALKPKLTEAQRRSVGKYLEGEALIIEALSGIIKDFDLRRELADTLDEVNCKIRDALSLKGTLEDMLQGRG